jgi:hypothetical protein
MTIVGLANDVRSRAEAAVHPGDWAAIVVRLHALAARLAAAPKGRRPSAACGRAIARMIASLEAAPVPEGWRPELEPLAAAIEAAAGA